MPKKQAAFLLLLLPLLFSLVLWPQASLAAAREGWQLCTATLIPSLFPFFVLTTLLIRLGLPQLLGAVLAPLSGPLLGLSGPGASVFLLGLLGGYPVGARSAAALYASGQCSRQEGEHLLSFCNLCGPSFLLGVVGGGVFQSAAVGFALYLSHIAAALAVGVLFRLFLRRGTPDRFVPTPKAAPVPSLSEVFLEAVRSSFTSCLSVCAFVLFFQVVLRMLSVSGLLSLLARGTAFLLSPLGVTPRWAISFLSGLLEVTSGVTSLSAGSLPCRIVTAAFLLGWGGLSVHAQTLSVVASSGLSLRPYFIGKLLHASFSALFILPFARRWKNTLSVFSPLPAPNVPSLAPYWRQATCLSLLLCGLLVLFFAKTVVKRRNLSYNKKK